MVRVYAIARAHAGRRIPRVFFRLTVLPRARLLLFLVKVAAARALYTYM